MHYNNAVNTNAEAFTTPIMEISKKRKPTDIWNKMQNCLQKKRENHEDKLAKILQKEYVFSKRQFILTSRFNNHTWGENRNFKSNFSKISCVYCAPIMVSSKIPIDAVLYVLEMNNDTNKIMGIGMVRNHPSNKHFPVYDNENYNRYQYFGKHRIDRSEMGEEEVVVMETLDTLCFYGAQHQKRGHGLKAFPHKILHKYSSIVDFVDFITKMFKKRLSAASSGGNTDEGCGNGC